MDQNEPIRILQINSGSEVFGGVSSFLYQNYKHIDRNKVQFDFISPNKTTYGLYYDEITSMGANIYELGITGNRITKKIKLYSKFNHFFKCHHYQIVHIHSGNFFFNIVVVYAAKRNKIEYRIVHSHNNEDASNSKLKKKLRMYLKPYLRKWSTDQLACSKAAADFMFEMNEDVKLIHNGIDSKRFVYDEKERNRLRNELCIQDKLVIGHVGRFLEQKNHIFLIELFKHLHDIEPSSVLILAGEGPLKNKIITYANQLNIGDSVLFLGQRDDVNSLYQAFDLFVLPSLYEGFGIVNIEAQATGLKCFVSDTIPEDVDITENIMHIPLQNTALQWAETIYKNKDYIRKDRTEDVIRSGYDINNASQNLMEYYERLGKI